MWNVGESIIKQQVRSVWTTDGEKSDSVPNGPYGEIYLDRKTMEMTRVETPMHAHNRAKRYMEKRLLRDLYAAWRAADGHALTNEGDQP